MNRLKLLRTQKKVTLKELGGIFNVSPQSLSLYELEQRQMPDDLKIKIADYFGVTLDYLLGRTNSPELQIPEEVMGMQFAFHGGIDTEGLSADDIEALKTMAEFFKNKNKNE